MRKLEHEIFRETITIPLDCLIEPEGWNPVYPRQLGIQDHPLSANGENQRLIRLYFIFLHFFGHWTSPDDGLLFPLSFR